MNEFFEIYIVLGTDINVRYICSGIFMFMHLFCTLKEMKVTYSNTRSLEAKKVIICANEVSKPLCMINSTLLMTQQFAYRFFVNNMIQSHSCLLAVLWSSFCQLVPYRALCWQLQFYNISCVSLSCSLVGICSSGHPFQAELWLL